LPDPVNTAAQQAALSARRGVAGTGWRGALSVFGAAAAILWLAQRRRLGLYDEGIMLTGGWLVGQGQVPYRDFYYMYGPAPLYLIAAAFKLFGTSALTMRALDCAIKAVLVVLLRRLGEVVAGPRGGWATAGLALVWMIGIASYAYPVWTSASLGAGAVLMLTRGNWRAELYGGVLAGLSLIARYDLGFGGVAALGCVLAWKKAAEADHGPVRAALRGVLPFAAGCALVGVPLLGLSLALGLTHDLVDQLVVLQLRYYGEYRRLDWPGAAFSEDLVFYVPVLATALALAGGAAFSAERRGSRAAGRADWAVRFLCLLAMAFFMKSIVRKSAIHVAASLMISLPLATACARRLVGHWRETGLAVKALAALGAVMLAVPSAIIAVDAVVKSSALPRRADEAVMEGLLVPADLRAAISTITARTAPDEPIFVATSDNDRAFVNDLSAYFLARRKPATRWYTYDAGLHASAPVQAAIIGDLERTGTRYVLLSRAYEGVREPNLSSVSSGVTLLDDYLAARFRVVGVYGVYSVLERVPS